MGDDKVRAKKHLGQHFLKDKRIAAAIVDSLIADDCDAVLEIGPGTGALTRFLAERNFPALKIVEIDTEAADYLAKNVGGSFEIIRGDFLKLDLMLIGNRLALIGNFPYNISSQIFFRIIENRERINEVTCMIQKEVADRICSGPGNRTYGILSVLLKAWYDIEYLFTVNENVFDPPPKVKSAVIHLRRNDRLRLNCDEDLFVKVVKRCFSQRRKMLRNPLKMMIINNDGSLPYLTMRAEQLSVEQYTELTEWIAANRQSEDSVSADDQNE
jgi:16S rRNA (adenine1518-N6/adenine1519-N6)-dimethyltransferase